MHRLDYESRADPPYKDSVYASYQCKKSRARTLLACCVIAINMGLLFLASSGGKAGGFVAMLLGPAVNALVALVALAFAPLVKWMRGRDAEARYVSLAFELPFLAVFGDFLLITRFGWWGC